MVHEDLDPYYEMLDKEMREIDNSKSSASVVRSFKATREWYQDVSMELQGTQATGGDLQLGPTWLRLKANAEDTLRETYSVKEGTRQIFEEQISVTIPGKTTTRIILQWKRRWMHGYVQLLDPAGRVVEVPFKIVAGVTFDQTQIDEPPAT
jgi:hypothetical protein